MKERKMSLLKNFLTWFKETIQEMRTAKAKHKILEALKRKFDDGENISGYGHQVTTLGRSMNFAELSSATRISVDKIADNCKALIEEDYVDEVTHKYSENDFRVIATRKGCVAAYEYTFKNKIWYRNFTFWNVFIHWVVTLISLTFSILAYYFKD